MDVSGLRGEMCGGSDCVFVGERRGDIGRVFSPVSSPI